MKKTITLLFLIISIFGKAQLGININIVKPDSVVYYADSTETVRYMLNKNKYNGDSVVFEVFWFENDTVNYAIKDVYYIDKNLPNLPFEPIYRGRISGNNGDYTFVFTATIGDTLSKSYIYDFNTNNWINNSKTKHYITEEGIDTLALSYTWDDNSNSWELNNKMKQYYIAGIADTLKVFLLTPDLTDTLHNNVFSYEYNSLDKIEIINDSTPGSFYLSIDSLTYNSSGLVEFKYYGNNYDCVNAQQSNCEDQYEYDYAEQYFYNSEEKPEKIYFWNKQGGLTEWEFDGCLRYYYSEQETNIKYAEIINPYTLYPNPCTDVLTVESFTGKIEIYNSIGQLIISEQTENGGQINTSVLKKGIYIVKLGDSYSLITKQ